MESLLDAGRRAMGHYERLSALDASFLEIEDENSHMHVAATLLLIPEIKFGRNARTAAALTEDVSE